MTSKPQPLMGLPADGSTFRYSVCIAGQATSASVALAERRDLFLLTRSTGFDLRSCERGGRCTSLGFRLLRFLGFLVASQLSFGHTKNLLTKKVRGLNARSSCRRNCEARLSRHAVRSSKTLE